MRAVWKVVCGVAAAACFLLIAGLVVTNLAVVGTAVVAAIGFWWFGKQIID